MGVNTGGDESPSEPEVDPSNAASDAAEPGEGEAVESDEPMRGALKSVGRSALTKFALLPLSAILGILVTRVIIGNYGTDAFAQYGLLVALGTLLPFADLGMAAAVMNSVGASGAPSSDSQVQRTVTTALRMLCLSAIVLVSVALLFTVFDVWPRLLGDGLLPDGGTLAAGLCLAFIAVTLPVGIGQRILSGLGKNHVSVALLGLQSPIVLIVLVLFIRLDVDVSAFVAVIPYGATFLIAIIAATLASRAIRPVLVRAICDVPRRRRVPGTKVFDVAWPALVQMIAIPLALQTDRIVLSHVGDNTELSRYNLASQMFIPIWQVTSAAGTALWPIFAGARAGRGSAPSPVKLSAGFAGVATAAAIGLAAVSPWLASLASDGQIELSWGLVAGFVVLMIVQAAKYPLGTFMTDAPGLRYQAFMIAAMLPVNLGVSLALAGPLGAVGPVIGSIVGVLVFQYAANLRYVRRAVTRGSGAVAGR